MNKKKIIGIVLGLFLLGGCCNSISNSNDNIDNNETKQEDVKNDVKQEQQDKKDPNGTNETESKKQEHNIPTEYKNALRKAESYSKTCNMSKEGIKHQLIQFEHFDENASQYAIDNAKVDYNKNALMKAESYQYTCNMSKESIRKQLVQFEKFTQEEADYAVNNLK